MSKQDAKNDILTGLGSLAILIFGYLLLKTINPDILNLNIGVSHLNLDYEAGDGSLQPPTSGTFAGDPPTVVQSGVLKSCPEGLVKVEKTTVCKKMAHDLQGLFAAARADGLNISGGGFRTAEQQIKVRINNCGGTDHYTVYEKPSKQCNPPTARPGTSRHEQGLAIDFTCDGTTISSRAGSPTKKCYDWMVANAHTYHYINYPVEAWHWSIDGK